MISGGSAANSRRSAPRSADCLSRRTGLHTQARFLVAIFLCAGCSKPADPGVTAVLTALNKRTDAIVNFSFDGTAEQGAEKLALRYQMKQPTFARATIGSSAFVYDGSALLAIDDDKKTYARQDLAGADDTAKLMLVYQTFSRFICEGWRPPLLRPTGFTVQTEGDRWIVTVPIADDTLKEQRLVLRSPGADFLEKTIVDKAGHTVMSTKVTEEINAAGMAFPKAWETVSPDGPRKIHLDHVAVNAGVSVDAFKTAAPAGYAPVTP